MAKSNLATLGVVLGTTCLLLIGGAYFAFSEASNSFDESMDNSEAGCESFFGFCWFIPGGSFGCGFCLLGIFLVVLVVRFMFGGFLCGQVSCVRLSRVARPYPHAIDSMSCEQSCRGLRVAMRVACVTPAYNAHSRPCRIGGPLCEGIVHNAWHLLWCVWPRGADRLWRMSAAGGGHARARTRVEAAQLSASS